MSHSSFWTGDVARHLSRAAAAAIKSGEWEQAAALSQLLAFGPGDTSTVTESIRDASDPGSSTAKSAAERMREMRARRRNGVTGSVTATVTERDVTRNVTPLSLISDLGSSSSPSQASSLKPGSSLEERASGYPETIEITEAIRANCAMAGAPEPTPADVVECLAHARQEGRTYPDWGARLVTWQTRKRDLNRVTQAREARNVTRQSRHVQPAPAGYADELIAAGERRAREGA